MDHLKESDAIDQAARQLEAGQLVAFPTETVYGLGADAENPLAIRQIYAVKGRPADHPVIVHLAPGASVEYWAKNIPAQAYQLMAAFWPGPLTLILQRADHIPDTVSGGQASIGVRCPSHPVAQALLLSFKNGQGGIAAPSANKFGHVSPTTAQHVRDEFADEIQRGAIRTVLEGGQSEVGIESSILDLTRLTTHGPVLLRPGHISAQAIERVLGVPVQSAGAKVESSSVPSAPRASGTLDAHYAPNTPVVLVHGVVDADPDHGGEQRVGERCQHQSQARHRQRSGDCLAVGDVKDVLQPGEPGRGEPGVHQAVGERVEFGAAPARHHQQQE